MSTLNGGPGNIITNGLLLRLDAANPRSYQSGSLIWNDLSSNKYDFTLLNGVNYSSSYRGVQVLDGVDDAIQLTSNTALKSTKTIIMWLSTTKTQSLTLSGTVAGTQDNYYLGAYRSGQGFYHNLCGTSIECYIDCNIVTNPAPTYLDNKFHMWEFKNIDFSSWTNVWDFGGYGGYNIGGSVGAILMYNRNLTSNESLQNFNTTRARFGI